jgi:hypothetical protein
MSKKSDQLAQRRERLIAQAAEQRTALGRDLEPWHKPLALADQGLNALHYLKRHPVLIVGGFALLAVMRPRNMGKWLGRGWVTWRLLQRLRDNR